VAFDNAGHQNEVSPSGLSRRLGILQSQHAVLAFLFLRPDWGRR